MLHLDLHDDTKNRTIRIGTVGEVINHIVSDMRGIHFTSRLFSTKGTVDQAQLDKEFSHALDRVLQRILDEHA